MLSEAPVHRCEIAEALGSSRRSMAVILVLDTYNRHPKVRREGGCGYDLALGDHIVRIAP